MYCFVFIIILARGTHRNSQVVLYCIAENEWQRIVHRATRQASYQSNSALLKLRHHLKLTTILDCNFGGSGALTEYGQPITMAKSMQTLLTHRLGPIALNGSYDVHTRPHIAEHHVFAIQMRGGFGADKELSSHPQADNDIDNDARK